MKQRCPLCESWSAEGATACPCGHQFVPPGFARLHRAYARLEDKRAPEGSTRDVRLILLPASMCTSGREAGGAALSL